MNDPQWSALVDAMGRPAWAVEQRWHTMPQRYRERAELDRLIANWTPRADAQALMRALQGKGVPAGAVQDAHDVTRMDPQLAHRGTGCGCRTRRWASRSTTTFRFDSRARPCGRRGPRRCWASTRARSCTICSDYPAAKSTSSSPNRCSSRRAPPCKQPTRDTGMHPLRDRCAIAGVGASPQGKLPGSTAVSLAVDAFKRALDDCGLRKDQIDGLLTLPGQTSPEGALNYLRAGRDAGHRPALHRQHEHGRRRPPARWCSRPCWRSTPAWRRTSHACLATPRRPAAARSTARRAGATRCPSGASCRPREQRDHRRAPHGAVRHDRAASLAKSPSRAAITRRSIRTR